MMQVIKTHSKNRKFIVEGKRKKHWKKYHTARSTNSENWERSLGKRERSCTTFIWKSFWESFSARRLLKQQHKNATRSRNKKRKKEKRSQIKERKLRKLWNKVEKNEIKFWKFKKVCDNRQKVGDQNKIINVDLKKVFRVNARSKSEFYELKIRHKMSWIGPRSWVSFGKVFLVVSDKNTWKRISKHANERKKIFLTREIREKRWKKCKNSFSSNFLD